MADAVVVRVTEGGAGFATNEDLSVKKIDGLGACDSAGVVMGMWVVAFQGEHFGADMTWTCLKGKVKATPKPWEFTFSSDPPGSKTVIVTDGGKCRRVASIVHSSKDASMPDQDSGRPGTDRTRTSLVPVTFSAEHLVR